LRRTIIKICGVTRTEDAGQLAALDADIIGLNFVPSSARCVAVDAAAAIATQVRSRLKVWAVFVDATEAMVVKVIEAVTPDVLQFNGEENPGFCRGFGLPYVKALGMRPGFDVTEATRRYADAQMLLLDSFSAGQRGGTGHTFDWSLWPERCALPLMLAGGLDPANVGEAVRHLRPDAVDVAGGVESAVKGVKDAERMRAFVAQVRLADRELG
jgi:phosphoribosylanthranilate isomerase